MKNLKDKDKGILLAVLGVLFITPDSLFVRLVEIHSWQLVFYRGLIPFICLLIFLVFFYKKDFFSKCLVIGYAGILNAILMASANITFITSLENTNVANTLIMISLAPFMAAILGSIFLKEHPNKRTWITMFLCFSFVVFIFYDSYETDKIKGDFFGLLTALIIGASAVVIRSAKKVNFLPSLLLAKFFTMFFVVYFVDSFALSSYDLFLVVIMGVFFIFLPVSLLTLAPRYIPAHEVELFFVLETALGPLWVWFFINEQPSLKTLIGGFVIISIIFIYTFLELREKK